MKYPNRDIETELHEITGGGGGWYNRLNKLALGATSGGFARDLMAFHENPDADFDSLARHHQTFLVAVPVSAGIDSTAAWTMAVTAGLPVLPVFVDTGAKYSDREWHRVLDLHEHIGGDNPVYIKRPTTYKAMGYVDPARNLIIIATIAERLFAHTGPAGLPKWGEIWFGNSSEWSETPVAGGDKCHRFFVNAQHLLTTQGHDIQLVSPLVGMTKADMVQWFIGRGLLDIAVNTRSCYADIPDHCGGCRSCWRRMLGFRLHGIELEWPMGTDWRPHINAYWEEAKGATGPEWSEARTGPVTMLVEELDQEVD